MNDDNPQLGMPSVSPQANDQSYYAMSQPPAPTPATAEDVDLIEKEWVEKAKQIVHRTQGDPYAQSQQLSQMKADYIKKRYNREVKAEQ